MKIFTLTIIELSAIIVVSLLWGAMSMSLLSKKGVTLEKRISMIILVVYLSLVIHAQATDGSLSYFFDALGFSAGGTLMGINIADWISSIAARKK